MNPFFPGRLLLVSHCLYAVDSIPLRAAAYPRSSSPPTPQLPPPTARLPRQATTVRRLLDLVNRLDAARATPH